MSDAGYWILDTFFPISNMIFSLKSSLRETPYSTVAKVNVVWTLRGGGKAVE